MLTDSLKRVCSSCGKFSEECSERCESCRLPLCPSCVPIHVNVDRPGHKPLGYKYEEVSTHD